MNGIEFSKVLFSLISLSGIFLLLFWLRPDFKLDAFRQQMFILRDELFDFAAAGGIEFDHPAYGLLRSTMNGYIRFAHRLNPLEGCVLLAWWAVWGMPKIPRLSFHSQWDRATSALDFRTKEALSSFRERMEIMGVTYVAPWFPLLVRSVLRIANVLLLWLRAKRRVSEMLRTSDIIDSMALVAGQDGHQ